MDYNKLLQAILDVGEEMVVAGAEVRRVEDSIYRMCESYGMERVNVFIIIYNIQVTAMTPEGEIITQIRCIVRNNVNFDRVDYLNDLSRYVCRELPDAGIIEEKLDAIMARKEPSQWFALLGCILAASGFTVFFGGNAYDAIAAALMAVVIVILQQFFRARASNGLVFHGLVSFASGIAAIAMVRMGLGQHADKIMMGGIMLLIPGIALTNAIRDMLTGDTASGLLRLCNACLLAAAIACGFAMSIVVLGGVL